MTGNRDTGKKAAETMRKRYGEDYFKNLASQGGKSKDSKALARKLKDKYGEDFYKQIRAKRNDKQKNIHNPK